MAGNVNTLRGHTPTEILQVGGIVVSHIRHDSSGMHVVAGEIEETFTNLSSYLIRKIGKEVLCTIRSSRRQIRLGVAPITEDNKHVLEQSIHFPLLAQTLARMQEQTTQTSEAIPGGTRRGNSLNAFSASPVQMLERKNQFITYIEENFPKLLRRAQRLTLSKLEAEDLLQDALLKAFTHLDQFEEGTSINSWIMQILRNTGLDRIKANKLRPTVPLPDREEEEVNMHLLWDNRMFEPGVEETVWEGLNSTSLEMDKALSKVNKDRRNILFALYVRDLTQVETADLLQIPQGTVMSRSSRGRHDLAAALPRQLIPKQARINNDAD